MNVVVWVEAGGEAGFGRLARATALVDALGGRGVRGRLVVAAHALRGGWDAPRTGEVVEIPAGMDALAAVRRAAADADAIVIDSGDGLSRGAVRGLQARWPIVIVDNASDGAIDADLVVDPHLGPAAPTRLRGPAYLPVGAAVASRRGLRRVGPGGRPLVLVNFGLRDRDGLTLVAIDALGRIDQPRVSAQVVANPSMPLWVELPARLGRLGFPPASPATERGIAHHLPAADFACLAMGPAVYEAMAAGVPAIVVARSAEEAARADTLADSGGIVSLGRAPSVEQLAGAATALARDRALRMRMAHAGRAAVDGRGAERLARRVIDLIDGGEVGIRGHAE